VLDNPALIATCVVGDGEAETGALATSWHIPTFVDAIGDGAVLPVLHLNGYKIANPTVFGRTSDDDLRRFFESHGWSPAFVDAMSGGDDPVAIHEPLAAAFDAAIDGIAAIQTEARANGSGSTNTARWPMIVLRSPKGWTGPKEVDGLPVE